MGPRADIYIYIIIIIAVCNIGRHPISGFPEPGEAARYVVVLQRVCTDIYTYILKRPDTPSTRRDRFLIGRECATRRIGRPHD